MKIKNIINNLLIKITNYRMVNNDYFKNINSNFQSEPHIDKDFLTICKKLEKIYERNLIEETNYSAYLTIKNIINQKIKGCIVECGVFEGQKISFFIETLNLLNNFDKEIYVIDTFEGMTEPMKNDLQVISNSKMKKGEMNVSLDKVKKNILNSNYPKEKIHFIKMDVRDEEFLKNSINEKISLLRLDTDFYDSTLAILNSLYDKVEIGGYLIHDDYGHWKGHYEACKKFHEKNKIEPVIFRTCRKEIVEIKYK